MRKIQKKNNIFYKCEWCIAIDGAFESSEESEFLEQKKSEPLTDWSLSGGWPSIYLPKITHPDQLWQRKSRPMFTNFEIWANAWLFQNRNLFIHNVELKRRQQQPILNCGVDADVKVFDRKRLLVEERLYNTFWSSEKINPKNRFNCRFKNSTNPLSITKTSIKSINQR